MPDKFAAELKLAHPMSVGVFRLQGNRIGYRKMAGEAAVLQRHALAHAQFIGRLQRRISSDHNARAPTCQLRLFASLRGFVARSRARSKRRVIDSLGCALGAWNEEPCV